MAPLKPKKPNTSITQAITPCNFGIVWMGITSLLFAGVGVFIAFTYQTVFWQIIDAVFENMTLIGRRSQITSIMIAITHFGYYGTILLWLVILGVLLVKKEVRLFIMSLAWSIGGGVLGAGIKMIVSRVRPTDMALVVEQSSSFPSSHAMNALILFMTIAYLIYHFSRSMRWGYLAYLLGLLMTMAIGASRIYVGAHYFSDVVAGYAFAVAWFMIILLLEKTICVLGKNPDKSVKI